MTFPLFARLEVVSLCQDLSKIGRYHFSFDNEEVTPMDCIS